MNWLDFAAPSNSHIGRRPPQHLQLLLTLPQLPPEHFYEHMGDPSLHPLRHSSRTPWGGEWFATGRLHTCIKWISYEYSAICCISSMWFLGTKSEHVIFLRRMASTVVTCPQSQSTAAGLQRTTRRGDLRCGAPSSDGEGALSIQNSSGKGGHMICYVQNTNTNTRPYLSFSWKYYAFTIYYKLTCSFPFILFSIPFRKAGSKMPYKQRWSDATRKARHRRSLPIEREARLLCWAQWNSHRIILQYIN